MPFFNDIYLCNLLINKKLCNSTNFLLMFSTTLILSFWLLPERRRKTWMLKATKGKLEIASNWFWSLMDWNGPNQSRLNELNCTQWPDDDGTFSALLMHFAPIQFTLVQAWQCRSVDTILSTSTAEYEVEFEQTIRHCKDSLSDKRKHDYENIPSRLGGFDGDIDRERLKRPQWSHA